MKFLLEYSKFIPKYRASIIFISPSEDETVYESKISVEARIKWADDSEVFMKINDKWFYDFTVENGKLFVEELNLIEGENRIKIIARNQAGTRDSTKTIIYEKVNVAYPDEINKKVMFAIRNIINEYYKKLDPFNNETNNKITKIGNKVIHNEYLSKWQNNRTFRVAIIKDFGLSTDWQELIKFLQDNKFDIFNSEGKYFNRYYRIMQYTTLKGKKIEERAIKVFADYSLSTGKFKSLEYRDPTLAEDKMGIDQFVRVDGIRDVTIQVKPLERIKSKTSDYIELVSAGDVRKIITDILIVANDKSYFIIKVPLQEMDSNYLNSVKTDDETLDEIKLPNFETNDVDKVIRFSTKQLLYEFSPK